LEERLKAGESLFKQNCSPCHPEGGNISDPQRSLRGPVLKANRITRPEDIVRIMRHPGSRMIRFDETTITDRDARLIAEYILATFK
jgi:cytochrome c6